MVFFIQILLEYPVNKEENLDQTRRSALSDLGLHCLPMSHKKDALNGIHFFCTRLYR